MRIPSPINWFGGKSRLASRIIDHFPEHHTYCEPFGGSAAVLLAKHPSPVEIYNDIHEGLVSFFRVLREPKLFASLRRAVENTIYARAEFELAKQSTDDPVEAARRFIVRSRQSFGGKGMEWSYAVKNSHGGRASVVKRWRTGIEGLPAVHKRFQDVQIECDNWHAVMARFDTPETLFYCDPPYIPEARVSGKYRHELTHRDHRGIVDCVLAMRGMIVLSGYDHETYKPLERAGWKRVDYHVRTHASDYRARRVESIWLSPSAANQSENRKFFLSPTGRMSEGAHRSHQVRVEASTKRVLRAIAKFRATGKRVTISSIGRATDLSREHLSRNYKHLFKP